jgi:4'-phosphopantetheinyl transferase
VRLSPSEIHVWLTFEAELDGMDPVNEFDSLLASAERDRAALLQVESDRRRFAIARVLQRTVLSAYAPEVRPQEWRFVAGARGKPALAPEFAGLALHFNLAHTDGLVALALSREPVLGIDVENCAARAAPLLIANRYFTADEARDLATLPAAEQSRRFYSLWTLKESWIKATGLGLSAGLGDVSFAFRGDHRARLAAFANDDAAAWSFWQATPSPDHVLALALRRVVSDSEVRVAMRRCVPGVPLRDEPMPAPLPWVVPSGQE